MSYPGVDIFHRWQALGNRILFVAPKRKTKSIEIDRTNSRTVGAWVARCSKSLRREETEPKPKIGEFIHSGLDLHRPLTVCGDVSGLETLGGIDLAGTIRRARNEVLLKPSIEGLRTET
jgi:hypothetical protein